MKNLIIGFVKAHSRIATILGFSVVTAVTLTVGYSNCSQVKFSQLSSKTDTSNTALGVCDPNLKPDEQEFQSCPGDASRQSSRTRQVYCASNNTWATDNWSNWDYSACICPIANQSVNQATGLCECPSGTYLDSNTNTCLANGTCSGTPDTYQQDSNCPSGQGFRFRNRTATCVNGSYNYTPANWATNDPPWIYSSCLCTNSGEVLNTLNGSCSCPAGQVLVGNACVTQVSCGPDTTAQVVQRTCQVGQTYLNRTTNYTYTAATNTCSINFTDSAEQFDQCGCSISGQILNQNDLSCNCPSGQQLIGGSCQTPVVCDPNAEPGPWFESNACTLFTGAGFTPNQFSAGTATRDRARAQCVNGAWNPNPLGAWNPWNFGGCVCSNTGETVDPLTGACECPPNYSLYDGACRIAVCTANTSRVETESCSAPATLLAASGNRTRTIPVQCINNGTGTQDGAPSAWDTSQCSCAAYVGTTFNATTRACECPSGGTWNGASCTAACNISGPTTATCGGGATSGQYTRTDACSAWSNNCACPAGQTYVVTNGATPAGQCQCNDPNLNLYNGQCLVPQCSFSGTQSETQYTGVNNCGYRTRDNSCTNNNTNLVYGQWRNRSGAVIPSPNDRYDLSQCVCPSNQVHSPDIYSGCACPINTVWNGATCVAPGTGCGTESTGVTCPAQSGANASGQGVQVCQRAINSSGVCVTTSSCSTSYAGCSYSCANNTNNYPSCSTCSNGTTAASNCTTCTAPQVMQNGSCGSCPSGWGWAMPNLCAQCGAGFESQSDGYCHACTGNTYSNASTGMACVACNGTVDPNHSTCTATPVEPVCSSNNLTTSTFAFDCTAGNNATNTCTLNSNLLALLNPNVTASSLSVSISIDRWFNNGNNWSATNYSNAIQANITGNNAVLAVTVSQLRAVGTVTLTAGAGCSAIKSASVNINSSFPPWCTASSGLPEAAIGTTQNLGSCMACNGNYDNEGNCILENTPAQWKCETGIYPTWTQQNCLPDPGSGG